MKRNIGIALVTATLVLATQVGSTGTLFSPSVYAAETPAVVQFPTFVKGEAQTDGSYRIVTENGKRYLELTEDFKTGKGPDLRVVLYRLPNPPLKGYQEKDYLSLGKLQKQSGSQRYEIPETVKLSEYGSVAIWCQQFNVTFASAKFIN